MKPAALIAAVLAIVALGESDVDAGSATRNASALPSTATHGTVGATIFIDPLRVSLTLGTTRIRVGACDRATQGVRNSGHTMLSQVAVAIRPLPYLFVSPAGSQSIGSVAAGKTKTARWTLCAGARGTYVIVGQALARDAAGRQYIAYSAGQILIVS